ncbi:MAG TPA: ferredoxin family protein [Spirochaetota bacterium]|nr:ferredoxin family protein [Spirochaetota bacterium]HPS86242.1 ferredoxin family protein [Spirochaetota bacterium]
MTDNVTPIIINEQLCTGCGRCVFVCAMGVIEMRDKPGSDKAKVAAAANPEYCMYCEACVIDCRRGAICLNPLQGSLNMNKISDLIMKKKKNRFQFWKK